MPSEDTRMIARGTRRVALVVARLGPYHVARLKAAGEKLGPESCTALEVAAENREYAWDRVETQGFRRRTLIHDRDYQDVPARERWRAMYETLDMEVPDVVAVSGWGFSEARAALAWCRGHGRVAILMSESQERDSGRTRILEALKRWLIKDFDSALVGGERHAEYLVKLGMDRSRIVTGYDVIDNDHFARGADAVRLRSDEARRSLGLPRDYFLCSARFIPKKNLSRLLEAFALYRDQLRDGAWDLVVLGDGPLTPQLRAERDRLGLGATAIFPGFKQYAELPAYYGLARAFILPSTSEQWGLVTNEAMAAGLPVLVSQACGSSELVRDGENGYQFDPNRPRQIADLMVKLTRDPNRLGEMGRASKRTIDELGPAAFGAGLSRAIELGETYLSRRSPRPLPNPVLWI